MYHHSVATKKKAQSRLRGRNIKMAKTRPLLTTSSTLSFNLNQQASLSTELIFMEFLQCARQCSKQIAWIIFSPLYSRRNGGIQGLRKLSNITLLLMVEQGFYLEQYPWRVCTHNDHAILLFKFKTSPSFCHSMIHYVFMGKSICTYYKRSVLLKTDYLMPC